jgi:diguanylate cyclase (GGDEF)-like protein
MLHAAATLRKAGRPQGMGEPLTARFSGDRRSTRAPKLLPSQSYLVSSVKFLHENKLLVVFVACGALLMAAVGGGFYLQYLNDAAEASRHATTRRLVALEETLTSLQDVRIHHAGLLITGKPQFRRQFDESRQQLARKVVALERLYPPDEHSERVLRELKRLYALKVAELAAALEMHDRNGFDAARAMFMSRNADDYGMAIRILIEHLKQRDQDTQAATNQLIGRQHAQLLTAAAGVLLLALLCGALAHASLRNEVRQRQALARRLEHEATHDALTSLPNRRSFMLELERSLARVRRSGGMLAILFIDLDGFKRVNDELGHGIGDQLLRLVAQRFEQGLRRSDLVARLGGDEFAVLADATGVDTLVQLAERLVEIASAPLLDSHPDHRISASIGLAVFPMDAADGTALLSEADAAMYRAKRSGKGRVARPAHWRPVVPGDATALQRG